MFDFGFRTARLEDGEVSYFTEAESKLLEYMSRHTGQVLSRDQILDAMTEHGSDRNDRNVDFLINRVRKKLRDNARDPRFIATRYGGGYVWLVPDANHRQSSQSTDEVFLLVGPLRGLDHLDKRQDAAAAFAELLGKSIVALVDQDHQVVVKPDYDAAQVSPNAKPSIQVELAFFGEDSCVECVVTCRSRQTGRFMHVRRFQFEDEQPPYAKLAREATDMAGKILTTRWRMDAGHIVSQAPLPVAMYQAAVGRKDGGRAWLEIDPQVTALRSEFPDDPEIRLMYATHLHSKYVLRGLEIFAAGEDNCASDEAEIEQQVLASLDYAQSKSELALIAAKLLHFVDRNYASLALELAGQAHGSTNSIASSLATRGQLRVFAGDTDRGIDDLRQSVNLSEDGAMQKAYTAVLLCQALIAADRRDEMVQVKTDIHSWDPGSRVRLEPILTDPDHPSLRARGMMLAISKTRATALLRFVCYVSSRHFVNPVHRANSIRTPLTLCVRRFGRSVIPPEVTALVPQLLD